MNNYKRYKSVLPETTIYNIRSILKDVDILLKEHSYENDNLFGCRLTINNDGLSVFDIGSNGKGRSYEYALASGYAEFMKRLQNDIIYKKAPLYYLSQMAKLHNTRTSLEQTILAEKLNMDFLYDPKEVQMRTDDAICSFKDDILQIFNLNDEIDIKAKIIEITKNEKVITVPVYSYKEKKKYCFP